MIRRFLHISPNPKTIIKANLNVRRPAIGWPPLPCDLASLNGLKIDQALAFADPVGQYFIGQADCHLSVRDCYVGGLIVLHCLQQKKPILSFELLQKELVEVHCKLRYWYKHKHNTV